MNPLSSAPLGHHLHVDGGLYRLLGLGSTSVDGSPVAIYEHLYPFEPGMWSRPLAEFHNRFAPIGEEQARALMARPRLEAQGAIQAHKAARRAAESKANPPAPASKLHCLGFMFSPDRSKVAVIRKILPRWQFGLYNGIGGKAEPGESSLEAMTREFEEEAGLATLASDWSLFARIGGPDFEVHAFRCADPRIHHCRTMTSEQVLVLPTNDSGLRNEGVPGLATLIQCALDDHGAFVRFDHGPWARDAQAGLLELRQP